MKVILQQDVKGQGKKGQLIEASDGYARNFLLPRKLAVEATAENVNTMKMQDKAKKARTVGEMQEEVTLDMQALYSQLVQAKLSYDAAAAAWENGQIAWNSAQSKNTLGMLSREEYLQEEMLYLQKKAAFESADLSLLQALENYQWAARGI